MSMPAFTLWPRYLLQTPRHGHTPYSSSSRTRTRSRLLCCAAVVCSQLTRCTRCREATGAKSKTRRGSDGRGQAPRAPPHRIRFDNAAGRMVFSGPGTQSLAEVARRTRVLGKVRDAAATTAEGRRSLLSSYSRSGGYQHDQNAPSVACTIRQSCRDCGQESWLSRKLGGRRTKFAFRGPPRLHPLTQEPAASLQFTKHITRRAHLEMKRGLADDISQWIFTPESRCRCQRWNHEGYKLEQRSQLR
jgi:hypothetical protein